MKFRPDGVLFHVKHIAEKLYVTPCCTLERTLYQNYPKFLAAQLVERGFIFKEAASPLHLSRFYSASYPYAVRIASPQTYIARSSAS